MDILDPEIAIVDHGPCRECESCGRVFIKQKQEEKNMPSKVIDLLTDLHKKADLIIKQNQEGPASPTCGFCGKQQNEVFFLIAGYKAMICDECVANCVPMIEEKRKAVGKLSEATNET